MFDEKLYRMISMCIESIMFGFPVKDNDKVEL